MRLDTFPEAFQASAPQPRGPNKQQWGCASLATKLFCEYTLIAGKGSGVGIIIQNIFNRAKTPTRHHTVDIGALDLLPGENWSTKDAREVVPEFLFVRDFGDDVIQVGVVHTETIAEALARLLDGEKVLLGLALNEKHLSKGSKVVAALHELLRVVDDGLGAGVGVVMLVLVEEDAHEGGSESDHLFVDAGIGSIKVKFGIFVINESLVKDADEANIADAPLEASVIAREIRRLVEVAEKVPLGLKALDGVGEQQPGPLNATASEVLDDTGIDVGATVGLVGIKHAAAPPVEHGGVATD